MGAPTEIIDALAEVVGGAHDTALFRSSLDARLWVQVSRVEGEDLLLCEAVSDEYVGRHEQLAGGTLSRLEELGWGDDAGSDYTRWEPGASDDDRVALAGLVWQTLVDAFGQRPDQLPVIENP